MTSLTADLIYGIRKLLKDRGFTVAAMLTLALGIGANSAIFSVVNGVLFKPFPFSDPERLVVLWERNLNQGMPRMVVSSPNFADWRKQNQSFEDMAAYRHQDFNVIYNGEPEQVRGLRTSATLLNLLGVKPALGRDFYADEDQSDKPPAVIIADGLWRRRFGANPGLIGQNIQMGSEFATVIGVMPAGFDFPPPISFRGEARSLKVELLTQLRYDQENQRTAHNLFVLGRMKKGMTAINADADLQKVTSVLGTSFPDSNGGWDAFAVPLHEQVLGDVKSSLLILPAAVGLVLLIACANVANLLLVRSTRRQREMAIRAALGAGKLRLIRQMLVESSVLSLLGGSLGLLVAAVTLRVILTLAPSNIYRLQTVGLDGRVIVFTLMVSLLASLIFGAVPAWQASRVNLTSALKEGSAGSSDGAGRNNFSNVLVIAEVSVAIVVLAGAGLLVRSLIQLQKVPTGFNPEHLTAMTINLPRTTYPDLFHRIALTDQLMTKLGAVPGIQAVSVSNNLPLDVGLQGTDFEIPGQPNLPGHEPHTNVCIVGPGYFKTMGIPITGGREFEGADNPNTPGVVIVSSYLAQHFFPNQNPVGRKIEMGFRSGVQLEIVGVAADTTQDTLKSEARSGMYIPYRQVSTGLPTILMLRGNIDAAAMAAAVRQQLRALDPQLPVYDIKTMDQVLYSAMARPRFMTVLLGVFAVLAVLLAAVGIYGVMSYAVAQGTREIGIRIAIGAQSTDILKLVVGQGFILVSIGVAIGIIAAFVLTRFMTSALFGVTPSDPLTFVIGAGVLLLVAGIACYLPARRGTKVNPIVALRYE